MKKNRTFRKAIDVGENYRRYNAKNNFQTLISSRNVGLVKEPRYELISKLKKLCIHHENYSRVLWISYIGVPKPVSNFILVSSISISISLQPKIKKSNLRIEFRIDYRIAKIRFVESQPADAFIVFTHHCFIHLLHRPRRKMSRWYFLK